MELKDNITGLQHLGIPCRDLNAACSFYQQLGFNEIFRKDFVDEACMAGEARFMQLGTLTLELYATDMTVGQSGAIDHVALNVQDIDAAFAAVNAIGLNNTGDCIHQLPFFAHGVKFFTISGPNGEKIEFNQYL